MLHFAAEAAFDDLLCCWRAHDDITSNPRSHADLARARAALDVARNRMRRIRLALYPEGDERETILETIYCDTLDIVVHLHVDDRDPYRPGTALCACGGRVPLDTSGPRD